jgi:hypothetical protein
MAVDMLRAAPARLRKMPAHHTTHNHPQLRLHRYRRCYHNHGQELQLRLPRCVTRHC